MSCKCYVVHDWPHYYGPLEHRIKKCALCLCAPNLLTAVKSLRRQLQIIQEMGTTLEANDVYDELIKLAQS